MNTIILDPKNVDGGTHITVKELSKITKLASAWSTSTHQDDLRNIAAKLFASNPEKAECFALAMHEKASWGYDQAFIEHWAELHRLLQLLKRGMI